MRAFLVQAIPASGVIDGQYDQVQPINANGGDGHFSVVFKARQIDTGRSVALKFLLADAADMYRRESFKREGELLSTTLQGEELFVRLADKPTTLNFAVAVRPPSPPLTLPLPYMAFDWQPNGDVTPLATQTAGYIDLLKRLQVFWGMCRCVSRAHYLGVAHRDLKPSNFFRGRNDVIRLGDFGTARLVLPGSPSILPAYALPPGDVQYAAPETLAGLPLQLDHAKSGDFFSLGAIFFELVTGQKLSAHILGSLTKIWGFIAALQRVPPANKGIVFRGFVASRPTHLPPLRGINPSIPRCAAPVLDEMLLRLCHLDYSQRCADLVGVHNLLRRAIIMLRHEAKAKRIICNVKSRRQRDAYV